MRHALPVRRHAMAWTVAVVLAAVAAAVAIAIGWPAGTVELGQGLVLKDGKVVNVFSMPGALDSAHDFLFGDGDRRGSSAR